MARFASANAAAVRDSWFPVFTNATNGPMAPITEMSICVALELVAR